MLYHYVVPYAGTYWYHPHVGLQLDRCLYGPFLVDDPSRPVTVTAKPGQRARLRIINPAAGTGFQVALGGHRMTVTHSDGYPVNPVTVDTLVLDMAERYDVTVTLGDGTFPFTALPLGAPGRPWPSCDPVSVRRSNRPRTLTS